MRPTPLSRRRSPLPTLETEAESLAQSYQPPLTGRPAFLGDVETVQEVLKQISLGNRREVACAMAGISLRTLQYWITAGQDERTDSQTPEKAFLRLYKRAEAIAEARVVGNVLKASEKEAFWAAGMTYLERKHPEAWGKRSEDGNSPKVIVQIGVQAQDVTVSFASPQVNVIDTYQTQILSEGQHAQALPAPQCSASEAKGEGRKSAQTLPTPGRGHGLTGPPPVDVGVSLDGSGMVKAIRRRGPGKKKGTA